MSFLKFRREGLDSGKQFTVTVNYDLPVETAASYANIFVVPKILGHGFADSRRSGIADVIMSVAQFNRTIRLGNALQLMANHGMRPADLPELLALLASHERELEAPGIVALGTTSPMVKPAKRLPVPFYVSGTPGLSGRTPIERQVASLSGSETERLGDYVAFAVVLL